MGHPGHVPLEHVQVGGLRLGVRRAGAGPALVLLHGALCDSRVWHDQLVQLSDEFSVVAWDAPGCGGSDDPPETFRLADYADCVAGLVDALDLTRPHLLGHSFGGGLALEVYRRHPGLPGSLVLAGGYAGWAGSLPPEVVDQRLRVALRVAEEMARGEFDPRSVPGLFSDAIPPERADDLAEQMRQARPAATRVMARAFAEADLRGMLGRVAVPTLLIYGDADERAPLPVAEQLHAAIPTAELAIMPGAGHESYLEFPESFHLAVRRFLRSVP